MDFILVSHAAADHVSQALDIPDEGARFAMELKKRAPKVKAALLKAGESYRFIRGARRS